MRIFTKTLFLGFLFFVAGATVANAQRISPELSKLIQNKQATTDNGQPADQVQMASVKIIGIVSPLLLSLVEKSGGKVFSTDVDANTILAKIPYEAVNKIAANADVKYIDKTDLKIKDNGSTPRPLKLNIKTKAEKTSKKEDSTN